MDFKDPDSYPNSYPYPHLNQCPAAQHNFNLLHQSQPQLQPQSLPSLLSQPYAAAAPSSSSSYFPNPLHPASSSAAPSAVLRPPATAANPYPFEQYAASHLTHIRPQSIASQSYADYYHQIQQQYAANPYSYGIIKVGTRDGISDLETKRQKVIQGGATVDSIRICSLCNVVCNSDKVFASHLAGEKHAFKAFGISSNNLKLKPTTNLSHPAVEIATKKASGSIITFVQSFYCEVCKIQCNSQEVLNNHKLGKKHIKNLQKLKGSVAPNLAPAPIGSSMPQINPTTVESSGVNEEPKPHSASAMKENLETKKQKVLVNGAAADAVRVCNLCNVVCSSEVVYSSHIAGKKHIAMAKKKAAAYTC